MTLAPRGAAPSAPTIPKEQWLEWRLLTGKAIDALDRDRTIIVGSVSPLEVHGPHLPVITDIAEAEGLLHAALAKVHLQEPDLVFVRLPPLWLASDVLPMTGSIAFRPSTLRRAVQDLGNSLAAQGFNHVWLSSFHGGPRHFLALEDALHRVNRRHNTQMLSVFSLLLGKLTEGGSHELDSVLGSIPGANAEAMKGDIHGGYIETSMMLHLYGEYVQAHQDLEPCTLGSWRQSQGKAAKPASPVEGFQDSFHYFRENTYAGSPAGASAELGAKFIDTLAEHTAAALIDVRRGAASATAAKSPLFAWRKVLLTPCLGWAFEASQRVRRRG
ncbi:MAG: creatininase family protein [Myxococcota bacterium]